MQDRENEDRHAEEHHRRSPQALKDMRGHSVLPIPEAQTLSDPIGTPIHGSNQPRSRRATPSTYRPLWAGQHVGPILEWVSPGGTLPAWPECSVLRGDRQGE